MQQRTIDRWIEAAEARKFCEWAMAEQPVAPIPSPPSLMAKLRAMVMLDAAHQRLASFSSTRSAV